jgi:hypothetical protein
LKLLGEVAYDYDNPGFLQFYFVFLCTLSWYLFVFSTVFLKKKVWRKGLKASPSSENHEIFKGKMASFL